MVKNFKVIVFVCVLCFSLAFYGNALADETGQSGGEKQGGDPSGQAGQAGQNNPTEQSGETDPARQNDQAEQSGSEKGDSVSRSRAPLTEAEVNRIIDEWHKKNQCDTTAKSTTKQSTSSEKGIKALLGGEVKLDYTYYQRTAAGTDANSYFNLEEVKLKPQVSFNGVTSVKGELTSSTSSMEAEEIVVDFRGLPFGMAVQYGLNEPFTKHERILEFYHLAAASFWKREEYGFTVTQKTDTWFWAASLTKGMLLATESIARNGEVNNDILADTRLGDSKKDRLGLGFGYKHVPNKDEKDRFLLGQVFVFTDRLTDTERALLAANFAGITVERGDKQNRIGFRGSYNLPSGFFEIEFYTAKDGDLSRTSITLSAVWEIKLPCYKVKIEGEEKSVLDKFTVIVRYGTMDIGDWGGLDEPSPFSPVTWDRDQLLLGGILQLTEGVNLHFEWMINKEDTGAGEIPNDEVLVEFALEW